MLVVTIENIGKNYEVLGIVSGNTIQSKNIAKDFGASFKSIVGGELKDYTKMMEEAREIAYNRMVSQASELGADAIVGMRFSSSAIASGAAEIICYGTAVKFIDARVL